MDLLIRAVVFSFKSRERWWTFSVSRKGTKIHKSSNTFCEAIIKEWIEI